MLKIYLAFMIGVFALSLPAKEIDLSEVKGTDQEIVLALQPKPSDIEVDADVTIKAIFKEPLNDRMIRRAVTLKKLKEDNSKSFFGFRFGKKSQDENIKGEINYNKQTNTLIFKPKEPLKVGYYEVRYKHLMKKISPKKMMRRDIRIKDISYRFYVPEVVNGYKLPPKPDEKVNNSTLLGIDANNNGVRDDVERFIVMRYKDHHKIVTEIGFQNARAYQQILDNPLSTEENYKVIHNALDCNYYFRGTAEAYGDSVLIDHLIDDKLENLQLNTKLRVQAYLSYDRQLSGGVYDLTPYSQQKSKCSSSILNLLGGE